MTRTQPFSGTHRGSPGRGQGSARGGDRVMVPEAEFESYYGRPVVKPAPWKADIPAYLFSGGVAAGSAMLAAGGDLTGRPALRRAGRFTSLAALGFSGAALVHDLGKPSRFLNMLRVAKLTSPMSVGTWILSLHGAWAGLATASEMAGMLPASWQRGWVRRLCDVGRPAGVISALTAPPLATYTAVLLADTATPSWHSAYRELPFVFAASAAAASGGMAMIATPVAQAGPARTFAVGGAIVELAAEQRMERSMGITAEPLHQDKAGRLMRASKALTVLGAVGAVLGSRSRGLSALSGAALMTGSLCTRFGVFEAGIQSALDPKYTVVPQRERVDRGEPVRYRD
jgi:hypothetical protein